MSLIKYLYSVSELAAVFRYDPETGVLYRRKSGNEWRCGRMSRTGHMSVMFFGQEIGVHRIAWALHYNNYPTLQIDHINGDPVDNRICNLRLATQSQNSQNSKLRKDSSTGAKNVFRVKWRKKFKWRVFLRLENKKYYEKHFYCFGHAIKHAQEMRQRTFGEFARSA